MRVGRCRSRSLATAHKGRKAWGKAQRRVLARSNSSRLQLWAAPRPNRTRHPKSMRARRRGNWGAACRWPLAPQVASAGTSPVAASRVGSCISPVERRVAAVVCRWTTAPARSLGRAGEIRRPNSTLATSWVATKPRQCISRVAAWCRLEAWSVSLVPTSGRWSLAQMVRPRISRSRSLRRWLRHSRVGRRRSRVVRSSSTLAASRVASSPPPSSSSRLRRKRSSSISSLRGSKPWPRGSRPNSNRISSSSSSSISSRASRVAAWSVSLVPTSGRWSLAQMVRPRISRSPNSLPRSGTPGSPRSVSRSQMPKQPPIEAGATLGTRLVGGTHGSSKTPD